MTNKHLSIYIVRNESLKHLNKNTQFKNDKDPTIRNRLETAISLNNLNIPTKFTNILKINYRLINGLLIGSCLEYKKKP